MCSPRRFVRLVLPLAAIAVLAVVVRSRRGVEVWHVAADQTDWSTRGALAQLVERCLCKADVRSSNLLGSTTECQFRWPLVPAGRLTPKSTPR